MGPGSARVRSPSGTTGRVVPYYVYILASGRRGTLYVGVTNDLIRRVFEHRNDLIRGFTATYRVHRLVYFEPYEDIREAIAREKRVKRWLRAWKIELIEQHNEDWHDLWPALAQGAV
jgi:putative endonuclease